MSKTTESPVWEMIEAEKKRDRFIKLVSRIAWSVTLFVLLIFLVFTIRDYIHMQKLFNQGVTSQASVIETVVPFLIILGSLSLVIGILATVGTFLRLRTTSMLEIQQRLANLENMVISEKE
ncbi:hypothetical protein [Roseivirga misakiensis]|nr:hypothetical protein [Roseivirga misakiensis]